MKRLKFILDSVDITKMFGERLGGYCNPGDVICLDGDLGAGKTTLSQAIARGLHIDEGVYVTSPSFAIMHEYPGRCPIYHMDFYRLQDSSEIEDLGFDEYFHSLGVCVIEWAKRGAELLSGEALWLNIEHLDADSRIVRADTDNRDWVTRLSSVLQECGIQKI